MVEVEVGVEEEEEEEEDEEEVSFFLRKKKKKKKAKNSKGILSASLFLDTPPAAESTS